MHFKPSFYRSAAVCSVLSAITTLLLIFLPRFFEPAEGFEGRMARVDDPVYELRSWVYLLHPFLALMAAIGVAARIRVQASAAAVIGLLGFVLWAFTEAFQQTLTLFAFDKWRVMYAAADELTREQIRTNASMYDGLWDAMYFLLLIGFAIGNFSLGQALVRWRGLTRIVGCFLLLAFVLTLTNVFSELQWMQLSGPLAEWSYPAIQPLGRVLIGIWLWRVADELNIRDLTLSPGVESTAARESQRVASD
jgi:hypothetical protein